MGVLRHDTGPDQHLVLALGLEGDEGSAFAAQVEAMAWNCHLAASVDEGLAICQERFVAVVLTVLHGDSRDAERLVLANRLQRAQLPCYRLIAGPDHLAECLLMAINRGHADAFLPRPWQRAELDAYLRHGMLAAQLRRQQQDNNHASDRQLSDVQQLVGGLEQQLEQRSGELAQAHSHLEQARRQMLDLELRASLVQLVRGLAHELNNPLAAIMGNTERLQQHEDAGVVRRAETILHETKRCLQLVERLRGYAAPPTESLCACEPVLAILQAEQLLRDKGRPAPPVETGTGIPGVVAAWRSLVRAIEQVLDNAIWAKAQRIVVNWRQDGERLYLLIDNDGDDPDETELRQALTPFFTTRSERGCAGLGLSLASSLLREMGGALTFQRRPDGATGARVTLALQAVAPLSGSRPAIRSHSPEHAARPAALIVDDEPMIAALLEGLLNDIGCAVTTCGTCASARTRLEESCPRLLLADLHLPDGDGAEVVASALQQHPDLRGRCVVITGDARCESARRLTNELGCPVVQKPFRLQEVQDLLVRLLACGEQPD